MDCGSFLPSLPDLTWSHILPLVWVGHPQGLERKLFPMEESVGTLRSGRSASELFGGGGNVFNSQITEQLVHYGLDVTQAFSFTQFPQSSGTCAKTLLPQNVPDSLERYKDREDTRVDSQVQGSDCTTQAFMLNTTSGSLSSSTQQTDPARPRVFSTKYCCDCSPHVITHIYCPSFQMPRVQWAIS